MPIPNREVRISSSALDKIEGNPIGARVFKFMENNSLKTVSKEFVDYRPPRVVKGKRWYVEYYFRNLSGGWKRFQVFEDINRVKTDQYADLLCRQVNEALRLGYNPFIGDIGRQEKVVEVKPKEWTVNQALLYFLQKWESRGIEKHSLQKYVRVVKSFLHYLKDPNQHIKLITSEHIENFLRGKRGW